MFQFKRLLIFSTFFLSTTLAFSFPRGCEVSGFAFQRGYLILNDSDKQTLFIIQNTSNSNIQLEHIETKPDVFMSPKLESKLNGNQWSAFASDINNFYLQCSIIQPENKLQSVNCDAYLSVCQYPRAQFPLSNKGNYWISTNKTLTQVIEETVKKGIYLKW